MQTCIHAYMRTCIHAYMQELACQIHAYGAPARHNNQLRSHCLCICVECAARRARSFIMHLSNGHLNQRTAHVPGAMRAFAHTHEQQAHSSCSEPTTSFCGYDMSTGLTNAPPAFRCQNLHLALSSPLPF